MPRPAAQAQPNAAPQPEPSGKVEAFFRRLGRKKPPADAAPAQAADPRIALRQIGKAAPGEEKKATVRGKAQIEYRQALDDVGVALGRLGLLKPVSDVAITGLGNTIDAAKELAGEGQRQGGAPDFAAAAALLRKAKADDQVSRMQAEWDKARKGLGKAAPVPAGRLAALRTKLAGHADTLNRRSLADYDHQLDGIERDIMTAAREAAAHQRAPEVADLIRQLDDVDRALDREIGAFQADRAIARTTIDSHRSRLDKLAPSNGQLPLIASDVAAELRKTLDNAEFAAGDRDMPIAQTLIRQVTERLAQFGDAITRDEGSRDEWCHRWADKAGELVARLTAVTGDARPSKASRQAKQLLLSLQTLEPGQTMSFAGAIALVQDAETAMDTLQAADQAWTALHAREDGKRATDDPAQAFLTDVAGRIAAIGTQFDQLHATVRKRTRNKHTTIADGDLAVRFEAEKAGWADKLKHYHDAGSLDGQATMDRLAAIQQDLADLQNGDERLDGVIDAGKLALAQQDYLAALGVTTEVVDRQLAIDAAQGGTALLEIEDIGGRLADASSSRDYRKATARLNAIATDAREDMLAKQLAAKRAQDAVEAALVPIAEKLLALGTAAEKASGRDQVSLNAALGTLQGEYAQLRAMGSLSNVTALEGVVTDLDALGARIDETMRAASGKKGDAKDLLTFGEARKMIGAKRTALGKADIKTYATIEALALGDTLAELKGAIGVLSMAELRQRIAALDAESAKVTKTASDRKAFVERLEKADVAQLRKTIKGSAFANAHAYRDSVEKRIGEILRQAQFAPANGFDAVEGRLAALSTELQPLVTDKGAATAGLVLKEQDAQEEVRERAEHSGQWDAKRKIVAKRLDELKAPKEAKAPLKVALASVVDQVKSGGHKAGIAQLDALLQRIAMVAANPNGLAMTARGKLEAVAERLRRAVDELNKGLDDLRAKVEATDLDAEGKKQVAIQVSAARASFVGVSTICGLAKEAAAKGASQQQRDAAREKALREVQAMAACLRSDYRMQALTRCPFVPTARALVTELGLALLDNENNLLVST